MCIAFTTLTIRKGFSSSQFRRQAFKGSIAFIAGWGLEEALKRADAYVAAGADAILMHSKRNDDADIRAFAEAWQGRHPLVIVPTKYYTTPTQQFRDWNVNLVIWANHNMRASIKAMQDVSQQIYNDQSLMGVEGEKNTGKVVPVKEVFRLQQQHELTNAEKNYLK